MKRVHYFAFGSNMCSVRLGARVRRAEPHGPGAIGGWKFACNKRGADGSAKANIVPDPEGIVWGVVYELAATELEALDRFEGGYQRIAVEAASPAGVTYPCHTYVSKELTECLVLHPWYKRHILSGAREHALPPPWRRMLQALPVHAD